MLTISPTSLLTYYQPIRTLSRHGSLTDFPLCHTHTRTHSAEFRAYEQTLFSPKSKETERLQLTSGENADDFTDLALSKTSQTNMMHISRSSSLTDFPLCHTHTQR